MAIHVPGLISIIVFYLLVLAIGIWAARKTGFGTSLKISDIMLANRSIGGLVGCFTMTATWVGGGYINGSAEVTAFDGLVWCQGPVGFGISLFLGGMFFAEKMRSSGFTTMLDPFHWKYGDLMNCLLYLPALTGDIFWTASILGSLGATLKVILDIDLELAIIVSAGIALLYTLLGGLYSVAYTDVLQLLFIFIGLWICVPYAMTHDATISLSDDGASRWMGELTPAYIGMYTDFALLFIFGGIPWQVYWQRALSAKSVSVAKKLSYLAAFMCVIMAVPAVLIGGVAASTNWTATNYGHDSIEFDDRSLTLPLVIRYLCPDWATFIGLGAVSAAVMSTADSCILSSSSMFARNIVAVIYQRMTKRKLSETIQVWVMRGAQVCISAASCAIALTVDSTYTLFLLCADLVYVLLFPQILCVMYLKGTNTYGSFVSFILGLIFRLLGGEPGIHLPTVIKYRWYDEENDEQLFPFRTMSMLIALFSLILVSYGTDFLFRRGFIRSHWDIAGCFRHLHRDLENVNDTGPVAEQNTINSEMNFSDSSYKTSPLEKDVQNRLRSRSDRRDEGAETCHGNNLAGTRL